MRGLRAKSASPRPRAAGDELARNLLPIMIPCHCIVRASGTIGAFVLGSEWQKKLLSLEKRYAKSATSRKSPAPVIGPFTVWF
jgi:O6-methylguanine-DNA--protein-cysteine methyltransferase